MICPKCSDPSKGSHYDVHNAILRDGIYYCPNCGEALTDGDVSNGKYSGVEELVNRFHYSRAEAEAIMRLQTAGATFEDVGGDGFILPKSYKITLSSGEVIYASNSKTLNEIADRVIKQ